MAFLANWVKVKNEKFAQKSKNPLSFENERGIYVQCYSISGKS